MILGIETSCDDTSVAILNPSGKILSNIIADQDFLHKKYGGIVPEIASREHLTSITWAVQAALTAASIEKKDLTSIAVTHGPGLIGSLLVGVHFARSLGLALGIPVFPIHHHFAHVIAGLYNEEKVHYPVLALIVSGGHTHLYLMTDLHHFTLLGKTRDDAAGEAFDKVAQILKLGFPGGPQIERAAEGGVVQKELLPRTKLPELDYSFSGLKTAVAYLVRDLGNIDTQQIKDIAATFQFRVVESLMQKLEQAQEKTQAQTLLICGGVSRNTLLRNTALRMTKSRQLKLLLPQPTLCTDNGAMIAASAWIQIKNQVQAPHHFETFSNLPLQEYHL